MGGARSREGWGYEHTGVDGAVLTEMGKMPRHVFRRRGSRACTGSFHLRFLSDHHVKIHTSLRLRLRRQLQLERTVQKAISQRRDLELWDLIR